MHSAGTLADTPTGLNQFPSLVEREIPEYYADENERWALATSGWTSFAWDVSAEDENALSQGKVPPSMVSTTPSPGNSEAQDEMIASTFFNSIVCPPADDSYCNSTPAKNSTDNDAPESTQTFQADSSPLLAQPFVCPQANGVIQSPTTEADGLQAIASLLMPIPTLPNSPRKVIVASYSSPSPLSSTSSTPTLSPSMSDASSLEDRDYDEQFFTSNVAKPSQSGSRHTSSFGLKGSLDLDLIPNIARSCSANGAHPGDFFHPTEMYPGLLQTHASPADTPVPTITPALLYAHTLEPVRPQSAPGPIRSSVSRSHRTSKPYERLAESLQHQCTETDEEMVCDECGYRQIPGPGATRSYKRHLETHAKYRRFVWICNGATRGGVFRPGCYKQYSRKDALLRHLRTTPDGCDADGMPSEISYDHYAFDD